MGSLTTPPSAECLEARGQEKHRTAVLSAAELDMGLSHDHFLSFVVPRKVHQRRSLTIQESDLAFPGAY